MKHTQLRSLVSGLSIALLALVLSVGVSYVWAGTWTAPGSTPPNGNVDAPVNIGVGHQNKLGSLSINTTASSPDPYGLDVFGISRFFGDVRIGATTTPASFSVVDGTQAAGRVLTSDAYGRGTWQTPSGGGTGGESYSCNSVDTGQGTNNVAWTGSMVLSIMKNGQNMCTDAGGCSWKAFSYNSSAVPSKIKVQSFYIQNASTGAWQEDNDNGINGDTTSTHINTTDGVFELRDDYSGVDATRDALVVRDNSSSVSYKVTFCDF